MRYIIIIILIIWLIVDQNKIKELKSESDSYQSLYITARNQYIETLDYLNQANDNIDTAKIYTWGTYDEMGYALDNLEKAY